MAIDGEVVARLQMEDLPRPEAGGVLRALQGQGLEVEVLSGDRSAAVAALPDALEVPGLTVHGGCLPDEKVRRLGGGHRPVAFVGDGLNDAPALAAADLGIAVGSGTDLAREHADVSLMGDDLSRIPQVLDAGRLTRRTARWNLFWAFAYNLLALGYAVCFGLPPLVAALAMVASSLFVIGTCFRLRSVLGSRLASSSAE